MEQAGKVGKPLRIGGDAADGAPFFLRAFVLSGLKLRVGVGMNPVVFHLLQGCARLYFFLQG